MSQILPYITNSEAFAVVTSRVTKQQLAASIILKFWLCVAQQYGESSGATRETTPEFINESEQRVKKRHVRNRRYALNVSY